MLKVTCTDEFLKKRLDITIKDTKHNGLNCVNLVKKYLEFYPQLKPLVLVLKYMMYSLDLSDTYQGGLNSYGLILMIVSMLQTLEVQYLLEKMNLGSLLVRFFHLYGWEIDYIFLKINPSEDKVQKLSFDYKVLVGGLGFGGLLLPFIRTTRTPSTRSSSGRRCRRNSSS